MAEKDSMTKRLLTAKDLLEMGEAGERCELVDGELVQMSPSVLTTADVLSGEDVLPGFSCQVAELFVS